MVVVQDERRRAFGRGKRAGAKTVVEGEAGGVLEGETLLLGAERGDGTFAGGVGGSGELGHVGGGEVAVVEEGVLEDGDDGLLELDDLLLELVFGYCCGGLAVGGGGMDGTWEGHTVAHGEATTQSAVAFIVLALNEGRGLLEVVPVVVAAGVSLVLFHSLLGFFHPGSQRLELVVLLRVGLLLFLTLLDGIVEIHSRRERANNSRT